MKLLSALKQRLGIYRQALHASFRLDGGNTLTVAQSCLEALSPFHLVLDGRATILGSGPSFRQVHGGSPRGASLETVVYERDGDENLPFVCTDLTNIQGRTLRLALQANPSLEFAAQLIAIGGKRGESIRTTGQARWILDQRPIFETLEDMDHSGLSLQDLSLLDPIRISMVTMLMEQSLRQELLLGIRSVQEQP